MIRAAAVVLLASASFALCQESRNVGKSQVEILRERAEHGDSDARYELATRYFEGDGVTQNFEDAAHWYGCPRPDSDILERCESISYARFPDEAIALLKKLKCDVEPNTSYDYGSEVDLNGDGHPEYHICCSESPHGPCGAVLIGRVGSQWKDLTAGHSLLGFTPACGAFVVLSSQHNRYHDICLPILCSAFSRVCRPAILQFRNGSYREVSPAAKDR
jgi:hypothetical protein